MAESEQAGALRDALHQFWPDATIVGTADAGVVTPDLSYAFVPSAARARLMVPTAVSRPAAESMRKFSSALSAPASIQRAAMWLAFRAGASRWLRDRVIISGARESLADHLSAVFNQDVQFSISVGSARANRKPILQVFDLRGRPLGFVKVGDNTRSTSDVRAECGALRAVQGRLPARFEVPELIDSGEWNGLFLLVMTPLRTTIQRPGHASVVPAPEMAEFSGAFRERSAVIEQTAMWAQLRSSLASLGDERARVDLEELMSRTATFANQMPMPVGAWHGDWTPWNMARTRRRIQLWDWERFETGVITGLDHVHFVVNAATRQRGFTANTVWGALRELELPGRDERARNAVVAAYLLRISARYLAAAEQADGERIAPQAALMTQLLRSWLQSPGR